MQMYPGRIAFLLVVVPLTLSPVGTAYAACDTTANALALANAREAIDAACSCAAAVKPGDHVKCAKPVIANLIAVNQLDKACKSDALKHATKSICGRPGAAVCCRVKTSGKTSHKIAKDPAKCVSTATLTACTSVFPSVPSGCDATGCIEPVCGNGVIEPGESCEPPYAPICDSSCQTVTCDPPVTSCGNGIVDGGEACEPPGVGACGWDCQTAPCSATGPGEIDVACASAGATVGAGARGSEYLLAWNDLAHRPERDIVGRRVDADGMPVDAVATVVSAGVPCGGAQSLPSVGSNPDGYVLAWFGFGPPTGSSGGYNYFAANARPYDGAGILGPLEELQRKIPFGMCTTSLYGPMAVAPVPLAGPDVFAATWHDLGGCVFGGSYRDPGGRLLDYATDPPAQTTLEIGYELGPGPDPRPFSDGTSSLATLGTDTLAVWHAHMMSSTPTTVYGHFVSGAWLAADGTTAPFSISSRQVGIGNVLRPSVAAASDRFLVAWAEGPVDDATTIRGMRVTHASGALDPDGGLVLATTAGGEVIGGPVAAYDGSVWLVAWTEVGVGGNDLRAVAVQTDGTVVDVTPRLLASGLSNAEPAIASTGDGRSLVLYVRPDAGKSAVRAQLVPGL